MSIRNKKLIIPLGIAIVLAITGTVLGLNGYFGGGGSIPEDTMTRGLVGYWSMDEGAGTTTYDGSGNNNTGYFQTTASSPKWTSGKVSGALSFDGTDDYVKITADASNNNIFDSGGTVMAWINPRSDGEADLAHIIGRSSIGVGWYIQTREESAGKVKIRLGQNFSDTAGSWVTTATEVNLNTWTMLAITYNTDAVGNDPIFYIDGSVLTVGDGLTEDSTPVGTRVDDSANPLWISNNFDNSRQYDGLIDEVRIYNRALSAEEVRYHYNRGGPVAHWAFDEGSGITVKDLTGNNNDGKIKSTALRFDGGNYVDFGDPASGVLDFGTGSFTYELWARMEIEGSGANERAAITKHASTIVSQGWSLSRYTRIYDGSGNSATIFSGIIGNTWKHYAVVVDRSTQQMKLYVNGGSGGTADITSVGSVSNGNSLAVGGLISGHNFAGFVDEVRIYNRILSTTEIAEHYKGKFSDESNLVFYASFDDESGDTATDYSGQGNNGDLTGFSAAEEVAKYGDTHSTGWVIDTDWKEGREGASLKFGGSNGFFQTDNNIASSTSFTHSLWFKSDKGAYSANQYLFSQGDDDPSIYIGTNGKLNVMADNALKITSNSAVLDTKWHHAETVADGTNIYLYLDGRLEGQASYTGSSDAVGVAVGAHISRNNSFNGWIDDVKIYNYARTQSEIGLDYNQGFAVRFGPQSSCDDDPGACMTQGLVGYWSMDEGTGTTTYDGSNYGNNGYFQTAASSPSWAAQGKKDSALQFDGNNDYVDAGNDTSLRLNSLITVEFWSKVPVLKSVDVVTNFSTNWSNTATGWSFDQLSNGTVRLYYCSSDGGWPYRTQNSTITYTANTWNHIAVTVDGTYITFYINGIQERFAQGFIFDGSTSNPLLIGKMAAYAYFRGLLDEIRIYNRALSAEEIRYHYNRGGPVAHWKFDEGNGTTTYDSVRYPISNNGYFQTVASSPTWTTGKYGTALSFDGTDDYVNIPDNFSSSEGTVELWFKVEEWDDTTRMIFSISRNADNQGTFFDINVRHTTGGDRLYAEIYAIDTGISFQAYMETATFDPSADFNWHHFVVVQDGVEPKFYLDGEERDVLYSPATQDKTQWFSDLYADTYPPDTARMGSIRRDGTDNYFFNGLIDDVRIYNYARTPSQIQQDYNMGMAAYFGGNLVSNGNQVACGVDPGACMTQGLVGYWSLDEGRGATAYDGSPTAINNGTVSGATWTQQGSPSAGSGSSGSALRFDGVDDYVNVGNNTSLNVTNQQQFTFEAWAYPRSAGVGSYPSIYGDGLGLIFGRLNSSNKWWFYLWAGAGDQAEVVSNSTITYNRWYHIVSLRDASNVVKMFVNGVEQSDIETYSSLVNRSATDAFLGRVDTSYFAGTIDEVRIYNRALSVEEVRYHYNRGGPVAHWKFDEGTGTTTFDGTENNNDGYFQTTASSPTWVQGKYGSALSFDGVDDYVDVGDISQTAYSFEVWVNPNSAISKSATGKILLRLNSGYNWNGMAIGSWTGYLSNEIIATASDSLKRTGWCGNDTLAAGTWHHIAFVWNSGEGHYDIYVNGEQKTVTAGSNGHAGLLTANQVEMSHKDESSMRFTGKLDEVRIYNYARSASQILQDYNAGYATYFK